MAILGSIRSNKAALITVIGLALFSFVVLTGGGDITDIFDADKNDQSRIAVVNGIDINRVDFMNEVKKLEQQQRPGSRSSLQSMNSVWDIELKQLILKSEFEKLGVVVEKEMMNYILKTNLSGSVEFQNEDGEFDQSILDQFISNLKEMSDEERFEFQGYSLNFQDWNNFQTNLADIALEEMYYKLIGSGMNTSRFEGEQDYFNSNDVVDFKYIKIPFGEVPDSEIKISKSDVNDYINANKNNYSSDPSRDLIFVRFEEKPTDLDESETVSKINDLLIDKIEGNITYSGFKNTKNNEQFLNLNSEIPFFDSYVFKSSFSSSTAENVFRLKIGEIYGPYSEGGYIKATKLIESRLIPDSAKVRHILIPYKGAYRSGPEIIKDKKQAKKTADSILNTIYKNRNKFKSLLKLSSDLASNESDGEIQFSYFDPFAPEFRDFSFENRTGQLGLVETAYGYHIIEILSQGKRQKAVKVGNLAIKIQPSDRTRKSVYSDVSNFEISVNEDNFRQFSKDNGFILNSANNLGEMDENIPIIGQQRSIVKWAHDDDTNEGDIKRFSLNSGGYIVAMLSSINEDGMMSYEKSSISALPIVKNQKKADIIIQSTNSSDIEQIASQYNLEVQTALSVNINNPVISSVGNEPSVVGYAMGMSKNETSSAIIGNTGVFYIYVIDRRKASSLDNYESIMKRISSLRSSNLRSNVYNALKEKAEIKDFRGNFY